LKLSLAWAIGSREGPTLRSLRLRLLVLTLGVAAAALLSVAVLSRVAVRTAYVRLESEERQTRLAGLPSVLADAGGLSGAEIDARLAQAAASHGFRLLLVGQDGRVRGASSVELRAAGVTVAGDRLEIEERAQEGSVVHARRTVLVGAPRVTVSGLDDGPALLFALPDRGPEGEAPQPAFLATVNRWLVLSALGSGALALVLTLALSRRMVAPLLALTAAARRMGTGDLEARVAARGRDEIGELGRAFNAMADALAGTESLRQRLVTDVAHELRTPLTNLRCQIEALQDGLQRADQATLRSLHEETMLLSRLVDDLQDLALAESGRLPLRPAAVDLGEAVEQALLAFGPVASTRGLTATAQVEPGLTVLADRERLGQVLRNLLANALTHTATGGAIVVRSEEGDGRVSIVVEDTGPGIAAADLPHVFDRFYRADLSRARVTGGAGLGLAIVKQLVEAQGGTVGVASEPGHGARFTFTLPTAPP
jgi:two-component system sensor histidine kinase BaeS